MRYLIVKASSLGDIIQAFPALQYLKQSGAEIDWVVESRFAEVVRAHPDVSRVIEMDSKAWRCGRLGSFGAFRRSLQKHTYDAVFDLQGNIKSAIATFLAKSPRKVGFEKPTEWPNRLVTNEKIDPPKGQNIREDYLTLVGGSDSTTTALSSEEQLETIANVMVCPGSAWKSKRLATETLIDFCQRLQQTFDIHFLWMWGTPEERVICQELKAHIPKSSIGTKLSFPGLQNLMARMKLIIAMDSLPLHLAGTTSTPTFSVFGPSSEEKYRPLGNHCSIQGVCPYNVTFEKRCPRLRRCPAPCIQSLTGEALYQHFVSNPRQTQNLPHRKQRPGRE